MNGWYIVAAVLLAVAAFCGYYGSVVQGRRNTAEQTASLEVALQDLGNRIHAIQDEAGQTIQEGEIEELQREYNELASQFYDSLPMKVREEKSRSLERTRQQLDRSRVIETHVRSLEEEAQRLVLAYDSASAEVNIKLKTTRFPLNVFDRKSEEHYYTLFSFAKKTHWALRVIFQDTVPVLQFVRLISPPGATEMENFILTNDSINLLFLNQEFAISLNTHISDGVREHVIGDLSFSNRPMEEFDSIASLLLRRVIEYQLLAQSLT